MSIGKSRFIRLRTFVWAVMVLLAGTVLCAVITTIVRVRHTKVYQLLYLTGATNSWQPAAFRVGQGERYRVVLGIPRYDYTYSLGGMLRLFKGEVLVREIPFEVLVGGRRDFSPGPGLVGYYLTVFTNTPDGCLDSFLQVGELYTLAVEWMDQPPGDGYLFLNYFFEWRHRKKATSVVQME